MLPLVILKDCGGMLAMTQIFFLQVVEPEPRPVNLLEVDDSFFVPILCAGIIQNYSGVAKFFLDVFEPRLATMANL